MEITTEQRIQNAVKWIDGLINDDLPKGIMRLGDAAYGYCCLGAGCMILNIPYFSTNTTSAELQDAVGLKTHTGSFERIYILDQPSLIHINDQTNLSLKEIGEIIRDNAKYIFIEDVAAGITEHYKSIDNATDNK